jgi:hypothetical protein
MRDSEGSLRPVGFRKDGTAIQDVLELEHLLVDMSYRRIAEITLEHRGRKLWISTIWLGINHNFNPQGPPLIFETMIFWEDVKTPETAILGEDLYQERYATEDEAKAGHERALAKGRAILSSIERAT